MALRRARRGAAASAGSPEQEAEAAGVPAAVAVPWALADLLRDGPAPLAERAPSGGETLSAALVLGPGHATPRAAGLPAELVRALRDEGVELRIVTTEELDRTEDEAEASAADLAGADVVLAAGWSAAPAVLTAPDVRARAVLATADAPPLDGLGWAAGVAVLGPAWLGGDLPPGADAAYVPKPVHRREDLVLIHGEEPFGLLAAAELHRRRDDLSFAVTGVRADLALPFPFLGVDPGPEALAYAFASATAAIAPSVRGWRPAATAMLACGQAVVAPDDAQTRAALGDAAAFAAGPLQAADAVEALLGDDLTLRAGRVRAGFALVPGGWSATAAALAAALRALP
jgi:hypothetical protein